jgi:hypothetical protein
MRANGFSIADVLYFFMGAALFITLIREHLHLADSKRVTGETVVVLCVAIGYAMFSVTKGRWHSFIAFTVLSLTGSLLLVITSIRYSAD